ncbi:hypothetical protein FB451DRAFT_1567239 [Mycena latifolia]|nr:hypothetical protein FB451DRAFT_1567239 [Mycena latifolia]
MALLYVGMLLEMRPVWQNGKTVLVNDPAVAVKPPTSCGHVVFVARGTSAHPCARNRLLVRRACRLVCGCGAPLCFSAAGTAHATTARARATYPPPVEDTRAHAHPRPTRTTAASDQSQAEKGARTRLWTHARRRQALRCSGAGTSRPGSLCAVPHTRDPLASQRARRSSAPSTEWHRAPNRRIVRAESLRQIYTRSREPLILLHDSPLVTINTPKRECCSPADRPAEQFSPQVRDAAADPITLMSTLTRLFIAWRINLVPMCVFPLPTHPSRVPSLVRPHGQYPSPPLGICVGQGQLSGARGEAYHLNDSLACASITFHANPDSARSTAWRRMSWPLAPRSTGASCSGSASFVPCGSAGEGSGLGGWWARTM